MTERSLVNRAENLGRLLRLWRNVNEHGTREFAKKVGISHSTLSRIENGKPMELDTWLKIQRWLLR